MSKSELNKLSLEFQEVFDKIKAFKDEHGNVLIKDEWGYRESFSMIVDLFEPKVSLFRKHLNELANNIPSTRKRKTKDVSK
jgi:phosphoenolpyruvate carboxylase